jgi:hypothetical protein
MWSPTSDEQARPRALHHHNHRTTTAKEHPMYQDPLFVNAELAYRRELFTTSTGRAAGRRHGHRLAERLHLRLPHRHTTQVRAA